MMNNRMFFKLVSCLLIQSFIAWDLCWAAGTGPIQLSKSTLAPAVSINSSSLNNVFSKMSNNRGAAELWIDESGVEENDSVGDHADYNDLTPAPNFSQPGNSYSVGMGGGATLDNSTILPPPPAHITNLSLANNYSMFFFAYFLNSRDDLEKKIRQTYGIDFKGAPLSKRELWILLRTIQAGNLGAELFALKPLTVMKKIRYVNEGDEFNTKAVYYVIDKDTEQATLLLFKKFFTPFKPLSVRMELLAGILSAIKSKKEQFISETGEEVLACRKKWPRLWM